MHSEIYRIAYQLNAEGKTPSVALIKARLSTPASLPVIIKALQKWKSNPELGKEFGEAEENQPQATTCEADSSIEQRLKVLEQKVDKILALLQQRS